MGSECKSSVAIEIGGFLWFYKTASYCRGAHLEFSEGIGPGFLKEHGYLRFYSGVSPKNRPHDEQFFSPFTCFDIVHSFTVRCPKTILKLCLSIKFPHQEFR